MTDPELTDEVRRRLAQQARRAPSGDALAERIIARAQADTAADGARPLHHRPPRTPWVRVLAAAAAVAVVAGAGVAVAQYHPSPGHADAERSTSVPVGPTTSATAPTTTPAPSSTPSGDQPSPTTEPTTEATGSRLVTVPTLSGVRVVDVTFTGPQTGWGLASADCLTTPGRCTALLRTTDGAKVWQSRPNTPFQVPGVQNCAAPCVRNIRFATDEIGYAYGPAALFMTTDGARSWQRLAGGADALETLDGNVVRVSSDATSCPPGCRYTVSVADLGSRTFTAADLPGDQGPGVGVVLARSGAHAYLLSTGNAAGGGSALATLWTSSDDGRRWRNRGEPCAQRGGEVDAQSVTTAADGALAVLCRARSGGAQSVSVSTDQGGTFRAGPAVLGAAVVTAFGAASASTLLVSSDDTYRSGDGGRTFARLGADAGSSPGPARYLGFSSDIAVHAISADGRSIYTSTDAGRTWSSVRFR